VTTTVEVPTSSTDPTAAELWRAARGPVAALVLVLLGGLLLALTSGSPSGRRLDPRSPAPSGGRAVAELLRDQGVAVSVVTTERAVSEQVRRGDTLLVTDPDLLTQLQVETVRNVGADLVLLSPTEPGRYVDGVTATPTAPGVRAPGCALLAARRAGRADTGLLAFRTRGTPLAHAAACYARDRLPSLVQGQVDGTVVTLVGSPAPFTNSGLDEEGNAALALDLLGARPRLAWYLPSVEDAAVQGRTSLYDLVPHGIWWGLGQLAIAVLLLALWRARRLGPVVTEPLPVVVRAAETVEGRGRWYRRAQAHGVAATALRTGVRARLLPALRLPRRADPAAVVAAVARRSGRPAGDVDRLLYGAAPADDAALVRLADDLDALEREVCRP
jgi:hypothetical protein